MTTLAESAIGFRCKKCWQQIYASVEVGGQGMDCPHCGTLSEVPEACEANLCSVEKINEQNAAVREPCLTELSPQELQRMVAQENDCPLDEMNFSGYANASLWARLAAAFLDGIYGAALAVLGLLAILAAQNLGVLHARDLETLARDLPLEAYFILYFPLLVGQILQWNLIATRGQSIGKFVCCIRVVTMSGRLPGFWRGVVLRNWLTYLLGAIPFFTLLDIAFIFTPSNRCIHDLMADTRVVQA